MAGGALLGRARVSAAAAPYPTFLTPCCVFCGAEGGLTNEDVLPRWLLRALDDASVTGAVVYRRPGATG